VKGSLNGFNKITIVVYSTIFNKIFQSIGTKKNIAINTVSWVSRRDKKLN
jgi:hypothetical protein